MNLFSGKVCSWCGRGFSEEPRVIGANKRSVYHVPCFTEVKETEDCDCEGCKTSEVHKAKKDVLYS